MEIFLPSFLILLLAAVVVFTVVPRLGPLVITVLSILLLVFGVYHHWDLFKSEYRLSTWQDSMVFKGLAPALVLGVLFVFILGFILSFFGSGVPVPVPAIANVTNTISEIVNTAQNTVSNMAANAVTGVTNAVANVKNAAVNVVANNNRAANNMFRRNVFNNSVGSLPNKLP